MTNTTAAKPLGDLLGHRVDIVYYLQFGERIKIGTTSNLQKRLKVVPHDRVLAVEPGGHALEHMRHIEFKSARVTGEWFTCSPELMAHVRNVLDTHGDPRKAVVRWILEKDSRLDNTRGF